MLNLFDEEIVEENEVEEKEKKPSLFDWLNSITSNKKDMRKDNSELNGFDRFIIARGLGMSETTIGFANAMNQSPHLDKHTHYAFYYSGIPKHRPKSKWAKVAKDDRLKSFMEITGLTKHKALDAIKALTPQQVDDIIIDRNKKPKKTRKRK